ncbi:MAG: PTS sugar transporter subunit IIB [Deferribacterota bacterium]|nr:PTS sugar transporter subunit IIB [Deferribacterota bacterium]
MEKKIIFRVDDRLIHGQVIEGWIKYYKINYVFIVNDRIYGDYLQNMIYSSILPEYCSLKIVRKKDFLENFDGFKSLCKGKYTLVLFESVKDLYDVRDIIDNDIYINIGCIASREHKIEITDTVFLNLDELLMISKLRDNHNIYIKKLPWETNIEIKYFYEFLKKH